MKTAYIKTKKRIFLRIAALLLCIWGTAFQVQTASASQEKVIGSFYRETSLVPYTAKPEAETRNSKARSAVGGTSYGSQLTQENEKAIYNSLVKAGDLRSCSETNPLKIHLAKSYTIPAYGYESSAQWKLFMQHYEKAVSAYMVDYSENYWISGFYTNFLGAQSGKNYTITDISMWPSEYYSGIRSELGSADLELQKLINRVKGKNRYEVVKSAHDEIIALMDYAPDSLLNWRGEYPAYCHTITGGLLAKYKHYGVCDCYARLFRLVCQAKGIKCMLVTGGSLRDGGGNVIADHIWNYVQMDDGRWYLVDCTWDDGNGDSYLLAGSQSEGASGKKVGEDHIPVGEFLVNASHTPFTVPQLSPSSYQPESASQEEAITTVSSIPASLALKCGMSRTLQPTFSPAGAAGYNLYWTSSNVGVATVETSTGYITPVIKAKGAGSAVIYVKNSMTGAVMASCRVTVSHNHQKVTTVAATCRAAGKRTVRCVECQKVIETKVLPKTAHKPGSWQMANKTSGSYGTRILKCTVCGATIKTEKTKVTLTASSLPLQLKKSTTALKVASCAAGDSVASWTSSNSKVVTVGKTTGKLTAKKRGTATIKVRMKSGATASCRVTVQKGTVRTKKIVISKKAATLKKGKTLTLTVTRTPITATDKITYSSSNKKVATVSSKGKITAKKPGKATITAKANGKKAKIIITVIK